MIKGNKNIPLKLVETFSNKFFSKSIFGFQFWTKKNVQKWKPEKSFEKRLQNKGL
jgi:hypothetical protein